MSKAVSLMVAFGFGLSACAAAQEALPADTSPEAPDVPAVELEPTEPSPAAETDPEVVALLQEIEAAAAELKTLRARVRYSVDQGLLGDQQRRFGDFYYAVETDDKPTRFAIHFDRLIVDDKARPIDRRYAFDGYWLLEENHDDKNATRYELVPPGRAQNDVLMLGGNEVPIPIRMKADRILQDYQVTRLADTKLGDQTLLHLRLTPRTNGPKTREPIDLWFDQQTKLLSKVTYLDNQGTEDESDDDTIELLLSLIRPNFEIIPDLFDTALPPASDDWQVQEVPLE